MIRVLLKLCSYIFALIREDVKIVREQIVNSADQQSSNQNTEETDKKKCDGAVCRSETTNANDPREKENEGESKISRCFRKFKNNLWKDCQKPKTYVEFLALLFLVLYTCETKRTNDLTQKALKLQRDSIAMEVVSEDWDFVDQVVPNKQIGVSALFSNIGHSPALYGIETHAFRWTDLPQHFPLITPELNSILEPTRPIQQSILDPTLATDEFIYSIPRVDELTPNWVTHHLEPPLPRPSVFFVGRLVYESVGMRTQKNFRFFMVRNVRGNIAAAVLTPPKTDNRFLFLNCPKWNEPIQVTIQ